MAIDRRTWLKQASLGLAALGLAPVAGMAAAPDPAPAGSLSAEDAPIRLSSNENPYGPSPMAKKAMMEQLLSANRYNWDLNSELVAALAQKNGVGPENVLLRAGSTEMIDEVVRYASKQKGSFVTADPSYIYWMTAAQNLGLEKIAVPLTAERKLDLDAMLRAIRPDTRLVYICNPNNPTGTICNSEALRKFVAEATSKTLVLVDEAYLDFTEEPSLSRMIQEHKNLIVVKTFSKIYGLAGARVGYAVAHAQTMEQLVNMQSWPNGSIGVVSAAAALASLRDEVFVASTYRAIAAAKKFTIDKLEAMRLRCVPSSTNFIYFSLENYRGDYFEQLKKHRILGTMIYENQGQWTRITVGKMEEMEKFIGALK